MNPITVADRQFTFHDVIDGGRYGGVAHLSHQAPGMTYGAWYSLCGRIVEGWRVDTLADTDHDSVCKACEKKVERRNAKRRAAP